MEEENVEVEVVEDDDETEEESGSGTLGGILLGTLGTLAIIGVGSRIKKHFTKRKAEKETEQEIVYNEEINDEDPDDEEE